MSTLKKLYGSKNKAKKAEFCIRKLNQWIKWANLHRSWNEPCHKEIKYGIN